jgi:hypothetical protein
MRPGVLHPGVEAMFLAAVPLGIGRRAIEEFTALAVRKVRGRCSAASATSTPAGQHILFSAGRDQAFARVCLGLDQPTYLI